MSVPAFAHGRQVHPNKLKSPGFVASQCITSVGIVEGIGSARSFDDLVRLTGKRSVYSEAQLYTFAATEAKPVKVIDFLLIGHLEPPVTLNELESERVFSGHPPQSICRLAPERFQAFAPPHEFRL